MRLKMFAVFDVKAGAYMQPFFSQTVGLAMRMFSDACVDPNSNLSKHPEDFTLFQVGEFDDEDGKLTDINNLALTTALEVVAVKEKEGGNVRRVAKAS